MTDRRPLRITYLLEDTALFGGVKVVLHHAELLRRMGHRVAVASRCEPPTWYPLSGGFIRVPELAPEHLPEADLHVATFWTTVAAAAAMPSGRAAHFCQGFEADLEHNRDEYPRILEAYAIELPTFAVSPHLAELNRIRFARPVRVVPPAVERWWRPRLRIAPGRRPRILVVHPFEFTMKGVDTALAAVARLRSRGSGVRLVRLSQWPLSPAERALLEADEFHHHLSPADAAILFRRCDLLLAPSWASEGFGLAVLEAMASGLPVVASRIPSHAAFAASAAELVPVNDVDAFADTAAAVLGSPRKWRAMRRRGLRAARPFAEEVVAATLDDAVRWAASGAWERPG